MDSMQASGGWAISELVDQVIGQLNRIEWGKGLIGQLHTRVGGEEQQQLAVHHCLLGIYFQLK
jgi:hypothetical protein